VEPTIVDRERFRVAGWTIRTSEEENRREGIIPAFWARMRGDEARWGELERIAVGSAVLGLSTDFDGRSFSYWIAREIEAGAEVPAGLQSVVLPAQRYAVFTARGQFPRSVWEAVDFAYGDWLKRPGHRRAGGPDFEWYDSRFDPATGAGELDLYIPIG
jgi:predicted transcriptional regulator YdeE